MDLLKAVKEGAEKPTELMYRANLSWAALRAHLRVLLGNGLLKRTKDGRKKRYELTLKGSNLIYAYAKIVEEVGQDESPATQWNEPMTRDSESDAAVRHEW